MLGDIVKRNWIVFSFIISIPNVTLMYMSFKSVDQLVTCGAASLVVFPFKLPRSGSNMSFAFTMSLLVMGQFCSPPFSITYFKLFCCWYDNSSLYLPDLPDLPCKDPQAYLTCAVALNLIRECLDE